ncbi:MAG: aspartate kinase [Anaerolineales bacterium]
MYLLHVPSHLRPLRIQTLRGTMQRNGFPSLQVFPRSAFLPPFLHMSVLVIKFGGTSVGNADAMQQAAAIVAQAAVEWEHVVVVTSALAGVTNLLLESAQQAARGVMQPFYQAETELRERHTEIAAALLADASVQARVERQIGELLASFRMLCQAIAVLGEASPRALDAVASLGERMSVRLLSAVLNGQGLPARFVEASECIVTDDHFQNAYPHLEQTITRSRTVLWPMLQGGLLPVVTGFLAATPEGAITTLGRGGSDYSAALLAAALPADEVWIMTDVDGVMTADPRLVPQARSIPQLTYREVAELAYFGAKVVHPKTIRPVIERGIGLRIANTFRPQHPGTRLVPNGEQADGHIKAVTTVPAVRLITIEGRGMLGVPGVAARTFGAVAALGVSVTLISQASSEQSICFTVPSASCQQVVHALEETFAAEIERRDIDRVWPGEEAVILTVVGAGMRHTPGIAGQIFTALGQAGVNVVAIAQGSSEVSISLVVSADDASAALQALHALTTED